MHSSRRSAWIVLALLVLVAAYFASTHFVRRHVDGRIAQSQGRPLPKVELATVTGERLSSAAWQGKQVVLNFFRSRCHSCEAESAEVRAFAAAMRERADVVVVSVLLDEVMGFTPAESQATVARHAYTHPVAIADQAFVDAFHGAGWAKVTPVTYVADGNGMIRAALRGTQTAATLRAALQ